MFTSKKERNMSYIILAVYLLLLTWLVMFKLSMNFEDISKIRGLNFIPFHYDVAVSNSFHIKEVLYNVLALIPLGVYVSIFKPNWPFFVKILPGLCISLIFETLQYAFSIGFSDITDIITNTLGGAIGIGVYALMDKIFKEKKIKAINIIGLIIEITALILAVLLFFANK